MTTSDRKPGQDVAAGLHRVGALVELGRVDEARVLALELLAGWPESPWVLSAVATAEAMTGRREEALEHGRRAIAVAPDDEQWVTSFAVVQMLVGQREEALETLDGLEFLPLDALVIRAELLVALHRLPEAEEVLERLMAIIPGSVAVAAMRGRVQLLRRHPGKAEALLRQALVHAPQHQELRRLLAISLIVQQRAHEAEPELRSLIGERPTDAELGKLLDQARARRDLDDARQQLRQARSSGAHPDHVRLLKNKVEYYGGRRQRGLWWIPLCGLLVWMVASALNGADTHMERPGGVRPGSSNTVPAIDDQVSTLIEKCGPGSVTQSPEVRERWLTCMWETLEVPGD